MSAIIPRWEWRAFGDAVGEVESRVGDVSPERVHESDEVYLLSVAGTDAVKVRDDLMDVKHLVEVDDDGLEQWIPVMKAGFPLSAADVGAVLGALRVEAPSELARTTYTFRELLDELVDPNPNLLAVEVHKRRERYTIGGCMAELTDVRTADASTRTFAIESEDAARVLATVRELGLAPRPNVSFARGLKTLVGFGTERYAVIDVGTNSVKFHIGERSADGHWHTVVDRAEITRLGDGLQESGRLKPEPMERTIQAIEGMADGGAVERMSRRSRRWGQPGCVSLPTARSFVRAVQVRCGVVVQIISGEDEARLAYLAAVAGLGHAPGVERRVRHGWWQLSVHLRARSRGPRTVQRRRRCGPVHRAVRPRRRRVP